MICAVLVHLMSQRMHFAQKIKKMSTDHKPWHADKTSSLDLSVFSTGNKLAGGNVACDNSSQDQCQSNEACTWCNSMAVPSSCYTNEMASILPEGVFECQFHNNVEEEEDNGQAHHWKHHQKRRPQPIFMAAALAAIAHGVCLWKVARLQRTKKEV